MFQVSEQVGHETYYCPKLGLANPKPSQATVRFSVNTPRAGVEQQEPPPKASWRDKAETATDSATAPDSSSPTANTTQEASGIPSLPSRWSESSPVADEAHQAASAEAPEEEQADTSSGADMYKKYAQEAQAAGRSALPSEAVDAPVAGSSMVHDAAASGQPSLNATTSQQIPVTTKIHLRMSTEENCAVESGSGGTNLAADDAHSFLSDLTGRDIRGSTQVATPRDPIQKEGLTTTQLKDLEECRPLKNNSSTFMDDML